MMVNGIDHDCHKMFGGNHDNYDEIDKFPGCMGNYGAFELNGIKGFFIRGAFSIDWKWRVEHYHNTGQKIMWDQEQLSHSELTKAVDLYKTVKPDFMLSHSCPISVSKKFGSAGPLKALGGYDQKTFTTHTQEALQECKEAHAPKLWIWGHFHFHKDKTWHKTRWVCRPELGWVDVDENLNIVGDSND